MRPGLVVGGRGGIQKMFTRFGGCGRKQKPWRFFFSFCPTVAGIALGEKGRTFLRIFCVGCAVFLVCASHPPFFVRGGLHLSQFARSLQLPSPRMRGKGLQRYDFSIGRCRSKWWERERLRRKGSGSNPRVVQLSAEETFLACEVETGRYLRFSLWMFFLYMCAPHPSLL